MTDFDVVFIDDDADIRESSRQSLLLAEITPCVLASADKLLEEIDSTFRGVVVTDIRMPGIDGLELFRRIQEIDPELPVILISGHSDIETAVDAVQRGAYDFLAKPFTPKRLIASIRRALKSRELILENRELKAAAFAFSASERLLGGTKSIESLRRTIDHVAPISVDIVIEGETGTGKSLIANLLHEGSTRKSRSAVVIDCGAIPEHLIDVELFGQVSGALPGVQHSKRGLIEQAHRSTLIFDAIDAMSSGMQRKLERVLDSREVVPLGGNSAKHIDVRIVSTSRASLASLVADGEFSAALYYRLNGLTLKLPPLRERREDIPVLFGSFLASACRKFNVPQPSLTPEVWQRLVRHDWFGNARELQHYAEQFALGFVDEAIGSKFESPIGEGGIKQKLRDYEKALIEEVLFEQKGDVQSVLDKLDLPRKTFYDKVKRLKIDISRFRVGGR